MSVSTPPPPQQQQKKSGCGCFALGCGISALVVLLFVGLVGGACYYGYTQFVGVTATTPADIPTFNATDASYTAVQQKINTFQNAVQSHQPGSISLTSDDINTLIAHNPDMAKYNVHAYVTLTGDQGQLQASVPTGALTQGLLKDRYLNFDATFGVGFDSGTKDITLIPRALKVGDKTLISAGTSTNPASMSAFNSSFNQGLRKNPEIAALLDHAKTVAIKDGQLVIETE